MIDEQGIDRDLPWLQMVPGAEGVVALKNGGFLAGLELGLRAYESLTDEEMDGQSRAFEGFLRQIPEGCELQVEVSRELVSNLTVPECTREDPVMLGVHAARKAFLARVGKQVLENRVHLYITIVPDRREPGSMSFAMALKPGRVVRSFREEEHRKALKEFEGRVAGIRAGLREAGLLGRRLASGELVQRIRQALSAGGNPPANAVEPWEYLAGRLAFEDVVVGLQGLMVGVRHVAVLSQRTYPDALYAFCLRGLARLPFPCRLVLGVDVTNQMLELERQQNRFKWSFAWSGRATIGGQAAAPDKGAQMKHAAHNSVIDHMMAGNERLLPVALNLEVWGKDEEELEERIRKASSIWTQHLRGSDLLREGLSAYPIWLSTMPGALAMSGRKRKYLSPKVADMAVGLTAGHASRGSCGRTTFWDREGGLVPFGLFDAKSNDELLARNCLIFAQMGGGKSVLLGSLILGELAHRDLLVRIVDVGGSTALVSELLGGVTQRFSLASDNKTDVVNPCDVVELDDDAMAFLLSFLTVLLTKEREGGLEMATEGRLAELLRRLYSEKPQPGAVLLSDIEAALRAHSSRRMQELGERMTYVTHGPYGRLLNRRSTRRLDQAGMVYYDLQETANDERLTRILMQAITRDCLNMAHRAARNAPKLLAMDEAWRITKSRAGATLLDVGARTARKLKMSFITVSQSLGDFNTPELRDSVVNNAEIQFILRCGREDMRTMSQVFKLNSAEVDLIRSLRTRKGEYAESFLVRPRGRQVVRLRIPPLYYWILTTDPPDLHEREAAFARFEGDKMKALEWLAKTYPQGMEVVQERRAAGESGEPVAAGTGRHDGNGGRAC